MLPSCCCRYRMQSVGNAWNKTKHKFWKSASIDSKKVPFLESPRCQLSSGTANSLWTLRPLPTNRAFFEYLLVLTAGQTLKLILPIIKGRASLELADNRLSATRHVADRSNYYRLFSHMNCTAPFDTRSAIFAIDTICCPQSWIGFIAIFWLNHVPDQVIANPRLFSPM